MEYNIWAAAVASLGYTDVIICTQEYASSKITSGARSYRDNQGKYGFYPEHEDDVYSYAVTAFELILGRLPMNLDPDSDRFEVMMHYQNAEARLSVIDRLGLSPAVASRVREVFMRAFENFGYSSAGAFLQDFKLAYSHN
ncbi:MAG: hypothetical protein QY318_00610 [Candidatus Dojkabacteria bacterium]|nr:MAG: hypothetical protein QY318_00610 [Candidatus Dojkabacteria bacterium]